MGRKAIPILPKLYSALQMKQAYSDSTVTAKLAPLDLRNYNQKKKWVKCIISIKQMWKGCKCRKRNSLFNILSARHKVHFWKNIDMRQFKLNHCRKRCHTTAYILGYISNELKKKSCKVSKMMYHGCQKKKNKSKHPAIDPTTLQIPWQTCESSK